MLDMLNMSRLKKNQKHPKTMSKLLETISLADSDGQHGKNAENSIEIVKKDVKTNENNVKTIENDKSPWKMI